MDTQTITRKKGVAALLAAMPESMKQALDEKSTRWKNDYWKIGDDATYMIDWLDTEDGEKFKALHEVGIMDVYIVFSILLNREASPRTIRYYADTASFFSPQTRAKYEHLPFTHFAKAREYKEHWQMVLDISEAYRIEYAKTPSTEYLDEKMYSILYVTQEELVNATPELEQPIDVTGEFKQNNLQPLQVNSNLPTAEVEILNLIRAVKSRFYQRDISDWSEETLEQIVDELGTFLAVIQSKAITKTAT